MTLDEAVQNAYTTGLMDPIIHGRLVQQMKLIAREANIPVNMIVTPLSTNCGQNEIDYVRGVKQHAGNNIYGLYYVGELTPSVYTRMLTIAGAFIRNFLNTKVVTVQDVLQIIKDGGLFTETILLIPNFYLNKDSGGNIPSWQVSELIGLLYSRMSEEKQTILFVESMDGLEKNYGQVFRTHIETNMVQV